MHKPFRATLLICFRSRRRCCCCCCWWWWWWWCGVVVSIVVAAEYLQEQPDSISSTHPQLCQSLTKRTLIDSSEKHPCQVSSESLVRSWQKTGLLRLLRLISRHFSGFPSTKPMRWFLDGVTKIFNKISLKLTNPSSFSFKGWDSFLGFLFNRKVWSPNSVPVLKIGGRFSIGWHSQTAQAGKDSLLLALRDTPETQVKKKRFCQRILPTKSIDSSAFIVSDVVFFVELFSIICGSTIVVSPKRVPEKNTAKTSLACCFGGPGHQRASYHRPFNQKNSYGAEQGIP